MKSHLRIVCSIESECTVHPRVYMCIRAVRKHVSSEVWVLYMMLLAGLIRHEWDSLESSSESIIHLPLGSLTENPRVKGGARECVAVLDQSNIL
jgi:hypothetical protein